MEAREVDLVSEERHQIDTVITKYHELASQAQGPAWAMSFDLPYPPRHNHSVRILFQASALLEDVEPERSMVLRDSIRRGVTSKDY